MESNEVTKRVRLNLDKWLGSAPDDGLTTEQALQELRGCPVPWTGSKVAGKVASKTAPDGGPLRKTTKRRA
jgi:hypothetical protein